MPNESQRGQRHYNKLRSSCDACGASKLKCDRSLPECGRCVSYKLPCVYGLSRRMGRRPREQHQEVPEPQTGNDIVETESNGTAHSTSGTYDQAGSVFATLSDISPSACGPRGDDGGPGTSSDSLNSLSQSLVDFTSLDFGLSAGLDVVGGNLLSGGSVPQSVSSLGSPTLYEYPSATIFNNPSSVRQHSRTTSVQPDPTSQVAGSTSSHDCQLEAHSIPGALSFVDRSSSSSVLNLSACQVPIDHVLRINRDASERLGNLFTCSCVRSPNLAFLYASILSRMLRWYEQAASFTRALSQSSKTNLDSDDQYPCLTTCPSDLNGPLSRDTCSTWLGSPLTTGPTSERSTPFSTTQLADPAAGLAKVTFGDFNVDDVQVQSALKAQLILGELKRIDWLINHFTSHAAGSRGRVGVAEPHNLYFHLESWLSGEYSRIRALIRSTLNESII